MAHPPQIWLLGICLTVLALGCEPIDVPPAESIAPPRVPVATTEVVAAPAPEAERTTDKTFDDLKFDIEPDAPFERSMLTPSIEALHGQTVRIRGWMFPTMQRKGLKDFVLVRDNQECCFGPGAALYDCIMVKMTGDASAEFVASRPITVTGKFAIRPFEFDGRHLAVFAIDATDAG